MCIESLLGWNCYYKTTHVNWAFDIKDLDRTMAQHSKSSISPYESLAMIVECDKAKRSCDDYDGAGLNGEGSSNDISNLKGLKGTQKPMVTLIVRS